MIHMSGQNFNNERTCEGVGIKLLTQVTRSHKPSESRYCLLNIAFVEDSVHIG